MLDGREQLRRRCRHRWIESFSEVANVEVFHSAQHVPVRKAEAVSRYRGDARGGKRIPTFSVPKKEIPATVPDPDCLVAALSFGDGPKALFHALPLDYALD